MRALVLGASGFVGGTVRAQMSLPGSGFELLSATRAELTGDGWVSLDPAAASPGAIRAVLEEVGCDVVVNCAGVVAGDQQAMADGNVRIVLNLLEAVAEMPRRPRIVQIGSGAEYGDGVPGRSFLASDPARPCGPYGRTKLVATDLVLTAAATLGVDGLVLRVFNPIGPGSPPHTLAGAAARKIRDAIRDGAPEVRLGPLDACRDFVDVRDVARAITAACLADGLAGEVLNVGSGRAVDARTVVDAIAGAAGYTGRVVEAAEGSRRSARVSWHQADIARTRQALGWRPSIDLERSARDQWSALTADDRGLGKATAGRSRAA